MMEEVTISREMLERYDKPGPRYTSYPTVPAWQEAFGEDDYRAALATVDELADDVLSIYVHQPFCAERCAYCGCNATVTRRPEVVDAYLDRVERELDMVRSQLSSRRRVVQFHWGGGTPNFMTEAQARRLYGLFAQAFDIDPNGEISLEVDPRIGNREQLELYRELGFNRISLGVQDIEPRVQQAIGRIQPFEQTSELFKLSRELGYSSVNLDIVYGLPFQNAASFEHTLDEVIALGPDRVACFSYAHVPWVKPNQKHIDTSGLPEAYEKFGLFRLAIRRFTEAGYDWIGMDHFARHDDELSAAVRERRLHRNFMGYTTRPAPHMLAFGMSGIGDLAGCYVQNDAKLGDYQRSIDSGRLPVVRGHRLSADDRLRRMVITHLMCNLELPYDLTREAFDVDLRTALGNDLANLEAYEEDGFVTLEPHRVVVTRLGRFFIRNLGMTLDAHLPRTSERPIFSRTV